MTNFIWLTDIHLNFLEYEERMSFYQDIKNNEFAAILISGDIAEATSIVESLNEMAKHLLANIYFVAGNHDYYLGDVESVRKELTKLSEENKQIFWLPACEPIQLTPRVVLIGQDGWADGRIGDYNNSLVVLNDSRLIEDLFEQKLFGKYQLLDKMQELADIDAQALSDDLEKAIGMNSNMILVLTHIPPFKEACFYEGKTTEDDWLPFFSSKAIGDVLMQFAEAYKDIHFLVLCGHTHHEANINPLPNLTVKVGRAQYYAPEIQEVLKF